MNFTCSKIDNKNIKPLELKTEGLAQKAPWWGHQTYESGKLIRVASTPKPTPETHKGTAEGKGLLSAAKEEKKGHHLARVKVS